MVSEQYHVNMGIGAKDKDVERMAERKVISKPIIPSENDDNGVSSVLEYFGITPNEQNGLNLEAQKPMVKNEPLLNYHRHGIVIDHMEIKLFYKRLERLIVINS